VRGDADDVINRVPLEPTFGNANISHHDDDANDLAVIELGAFKAVAVVLLVVCSDVLW
jgi:hypothetical protein